LFCFWQRACVTVCGPDNAMMPASYQDHCYASCRVKGMLSFFCCLFNVTNTQPWYTHLPSSVSHHRCDPGQRHGHYPLHHCVWQHHRLLLQSGLHPQRYSRHFCHKFAYCGNILASFAVSPLSPCHPTQCACSSLASTVARWTLFRVPYLPDRHTYIPAVANPG